MTDHDYIMLGGLIICAVLLLLAVDLATRGPERRAAKRLRKLFRADLSPGLPVIRAMPRRKKP